MINLKEKRNDRLPNYRICFKVPCMKWKRNLPYLETSLKPIIALINHNKTIDVLKESGRLWYKCLVNYLETGFEEKRNKPCILIKINGDRITMIVGFFVDDLIISGENKKDIDKFTSQFNEQFSIKITKADNRGWKDYRHYSKE